MMNMMFCKIYQTLKIFDISMGRNVFVCQVDLGLHHTSIILSTFLFFLYLDLLFQFYFENGFL